MRYLFVFMVMYMPCFVFAGTQKDGIRFEEGLTWEQVKQKAKLEKKFIFVDCYATWCGPCKKMDSEVYEDARVAELMNEKFISVKVQMDSTKGDADQIKKLFPAARMFEKSYNVSALPTYLFFSPDGQIVHRDQGTKSVVEFIALAKTIEDPNKQVYTMMEKWRMGKLSYSSLPELVLTLKEYKDSSAFEVARDYMKNYLEKLPEVDFLKKVNLQFILTNNKMLSSNDLLFKLAYNQPNLIDSVLSEPKSAARLVNSVIYKEEILSALLESATRKTDPDWTKISNVLASKYLVKYTSGMIINAKISWYRSQKDWKHYSKHLVEKMKMEENTFFESSTGNMMYLNALGDELFKHSNKRSELKVALKTSEKAIAIESNASTLDTKANILYKLGKRNKALKLYEKAVQLYPGYAVYYKCMELGLPTWPEAVWSRKMEKRKEEAKLFRERFRDQQAESFSKADLRNFQSNPNFSGTWVINYFKSKFNTYPGYAAAKKFIINQQGDSMVIERFNTVEGNKDTYSKEKFSTDNKDNTISSDLTKVKEVIAKWSIDGRVLTTVGTSKSLNKKSNDDVTRTQQWGLSNDGKTLIVEQATTVGSSSPYTVIAVYNKYEN